MNLEADGREDDLAQNENAVDIFVLCSHPDDIRDLAENLSSSGYRITQFMDRDSLLESLQAGKPNLLIIDSPSTGKEGFEVCRELKADPDLWRIPVLVVTGVNDLGNLLSVLDCNADNFIAQPYDPQYLLSLVDTMLISAVEKPDPDKIKTQFKIRHEDTDYVITADRRKLLEFLLSSFEIAIGRSGELVHRDEELSELRSTLDRQVADRTRELSTEVTHLETLIRERSREIEELRAQASEHQNGTDDLNRQLDERDKTILSQKESLEQANQELESARSRLAETEDTLRTLQTEKDELGHSLQGDIEKTREELKTTKEDLQAAAARLEQESGIRAGLEEKVARLAAEADTITSEKSARLIEIEQLKSAVAAEKTRAASAEQEVKSLLQEKDQAEQDLRQMIEDITAKAKIQAEEAQRLAEELDKEKQLREDAEKVHDNLRVETARKESALATEKDSLKQHADELQKKFDTLTESFGAQGQKCASLELEITALSEKNGELAAEIKSLNDRIDTAAAAYEDEKRHHLCTQKNLRELSETKEREKQEFEAALDNLRKEEDALKADLVRAGQEKETLAAANKEFEDQFSAARIAGEESEKRARSATADLEQANEELESERRLRHAAEENFHALTLEKENLARDLADREEKIRQLSEESEAHRETHGTLEEQIATLTKELGEAKARAEVLAAEKESLSRQSEESVRQVTAELDDLKAKASAGEEELARAKADLEARMSEFNAQKEESDRVVAERDERIRQLSEESEAHRETHGTLEEQVATLTKELGDVKARAEGLAAEKESISRQSEESVRQVTAELDDLKAKASAGEEELARARADLETRTKELNAQKEESDRVVAERDERIRQLSEESEAHRETHGTLEEQIAALTKELGEAKVRAEGLAAEKDALQQRSEESVRQVAAELDDLRAHASTGEEELARARADLETRTKELDALREEKNRDVAERDEKIRQLSEESEAHQKTHGSLEERIAGLTADLEAQKAQVSVLTSEKDSLHQKSEETLRLVTAELEKERAAASARIDEFEAIQREKIVSDQKISVLENQIARIPLLETDLAAERGAVAARENGYEDRIRSLNERLLAEQTAKENAERSLGESRGKIAELTDRVLALEVTGGKSGEDELTTATKRMQALEEQLLEAGHELAQKDAAIQELSAKVEQAMEELSEERELHGKAKDELSAARETLAAARRPVIPEAASHLPVIQEHALVRKDPELPTLVRHETRDLSVSTPAQVPVPLPAQPETEGLTGEKPEPGLLIRSLEDLFEDPKETSSHPGRENDETTDGEYGRETFVRPGEFPAAEIPDLPKEPAGGTMSAGEDGPEVSPMPAEVPESGTDAAETDNADSAPSEESGIVSMDVPADVQADEHGEIVADDAGAAVEPDTLPAGTETDDMAEPSGDDEEPTEEPEEESSDESSFEQETEYQPAGAGLSDGAQWYALVKWAHHAQGLTKEQRIRIFKFGRLVQKGKKLSKRQEDEISEILALAHTMGYRSGN